jgi:predicted phosphodiesterase
VDQIVLEFPILADYAYILTDGIRIFVTHGHKFNTETPPKLSRGDILLHGHTHVPVAIPFGNDNLYINPGSVSIPKENSHKGYILYQNKRFDFCDLDGNIVNSIDV